MCTNGTHSEAKNGQVFLDAARSTSLTLIIPSHCKFLLQHGGLREMFSLSVGEGRFLFPRLLSQKYLDFPS